MAQQRAAFSTAARLHPSIVPHLHKQSRSIPIKSLTTLTAVALAAYGAKRYVVDHVPERDPRQREHEQGIRRRYASASSALGDESEAAAMRERNERLLDMYGDRESLEALERAVQFYEKK